jgi:predicted ArsR family transcriptional regulator
VRKLPHNGRLLELAQRFPTDQALADHLGVPRTTLRDHIYRLGMREAVNSVRYVPEVARPNEIQLIRRDYSHEGKHYVYPLGDVHKGARTHDAVLWREWLNYLADREYASLLGTGDFLNAAIVGSKSDIYEERMTVGEAKREIREELRPLAELGRIDGLAPGNHEDRITRAIGDCPILDICDTLNVPYIPAAALFVYTVGDFEYEVYVRHGSGMGQSLTTLSKSGTVIRADVYVTGHVHQQAARPEDYFVRRGDEIHRAKRYYVSSGSFLGYEKYAAQRGYQPSRMGAPRIFLDGRRWDVHISL